MAIMKEKLMKSLEPVCDDINKSLELLYTKEAMENFAKHKYQLNAEGEEIGEFLNQIHFKILESISITEAEHYNDASEAKLKDFKFTISGKNFLIYRFLYCYIVINIANIDKSFPKVTKLIMEVFSVKSLNEFYNKLNTNCFDQEGNRMPMNILLICYSRNNETH